MKLLYSKQLLLFLMLVLVIMVFQFIIGMLVIVLCKLVRRVLTSCVSVMRVAMFVLVSVLVIVRVGMLSRAV